MLLLISLWLVAIYEDPKPLPVHELWKQLADVKAEQKTQLESIAQEYADRIAELEAQRNDKMLAILSREQVKKLSEIVAERNQKYRVMVKDKPRPAQVPMISKVLKEQLKLTDAEAKGRIEKAPGQPLAMDLDKAKAEALVKAFPGAAGRFSVEKQINP